MDALLWYYLLQQMGLDPSGGYAPQYYDPYGGYYPQPYPPQPQGGYYPQPAPHYPPQPAPYYPPQPTPYYPPQGGYTGATLPTPPAAQPPVQPWSGTVPTQPGVRVAPPYIPPGSPGTSYSPQAAPAYRPATPGPLPISPAPVVRTTFDPLVGQTPRCSQVPAGYVGRCV